MTARPTTRVRARALRQRGRTLVELLIAIVLSLLIVSAVGSLYYFTSQSARTAQQSSSAEERGHTGMFLLGEPIMMAGFGNVNSGALSTRFGAVALQGPHLRACTNARFNDPANLDFTCVPSATPGDALFVAFQAESAAGIAPQGTQPLRDCTGANAPLIGDALTVRNAYSIEQTAGGALELQCLGNGGGQRQGLIRDVEDFKVYFAFDTAGYNRAGVNPANFTVQPSTLLTAAQINAMPVVQNEDPNTSASNAWNHVVAVLVCLQLRATEAGSTPDGVSRYRPCPQNEVEAATGTAEVAVNDGFARRTVVQVFTLRARAQAAPASQFQP
ncbi:MAG TPA: PilW family protein [Burkholderiaceae bacterium]|nr:PilW family protein [Burkholderiaceae bacterium]